MKSGEMFGTKTYFMREAQLLALTEAAPSLPTDEYGVLQLANVGCSTYRESLSIGALLLKRNLDFQIRAMDRNRTALREGNQALKTGYEVTVPELKRLEDRGLLEYFETDNRWIRPLPELVDRIIPSRKDIIKAPLEKGAYGAVVCNWMLPYYDLREQYRIARNLSHGVALGGVLVSREDYTFREYQQSEGDLRPVFQETVDFGGNKRKLALYQKVGLGGLVSFSQPRPATAA